MKLLLYSLLVGAMTTLATGQNQLFDSGSNGSYGAMNITATTRLQVPPDGIFHCTTITVASGAVLRFTRNSLNTPVYLLATGDVVINANGQISVDAEYLSNRSLSQPGGPGGYDGGSPGIGTSTPAGSGFGPGGGAPNGGGAYATRGAGGNATANGAVYGSPLLYPIVGGSGAGGQSGSGQSTFGLGGAGGGGALLIASNTRIRLLGNGSLNLSANGLYSGYGSPAGVYSSGGAVRLVAPGVYGGGAIQATAAAGGDGRIRIDSIFRVDPQDSALSLNISSTPGFYLGSTMLTGLVNPPKLDILEAAGTTIPEGVSTSVFVSLPSNSSPNRTVTVQARNFAAAVPIRVVLIPDSGATVSYDAQIDNSSSNPATAVVNVVLPTNVRVGVQVWTR